MKRILKLSIVASRRRSSSRGGELLVHLDEHLARLRVDDVVRGDLAIELLRLDGHALELGLLHLADGRPGELGVLLDEDVGAQLHVSGGALAGEEVVLDALRVLVALLDVDGLRRVEVVEEVLRGVAERAEQHGGVHLPPPIDADVDDVLGIELEVEPGAPVGDHARRVEELARRVGLALVVVEEDARAPVELADNHALGAVDDERARLGHQGQLAEVDLLLLDVAHDPLPAVAGVVDHELVRHLDGRRERHAALAALVDVVLGRLEVVGHEHELARAVEVLDGEDRSKDRLEPNLFPLVRRDVHLEELVVARLLDVDQVGDVDDATHPTEVLADAEVGLDDRRHRFPPALPVRGHPPRDTNRAAGGAIAPPLEAAITSSAGSPEHAAGLSPGRADGRAWAN